MSLNIGIERKTSGRKEEDQGDMEDKINEENKKFKSKTEQAENEWEQRRESK